MFAFAILGTILAFVETINSLLNSLLNKCKLKFIHPVFLSIAVCIFEELPQAGLRWNLRMSADKDIVDCWEYTSGIFAVIAPLLAPILMFLETLACCKCCTKDKTFCLKTCSTGWVLLAAFFLILMACGVVVLNALNWKGYKAPGSNSNGTWCG